MLVVLEVNVKRAVVKFNFGNEKYQAKYKS